MSLIIEFDSLAVSLGERTVLRVGRLEVEEGETLAVIGPNGAGKSTLLRVSAKLIEPSAGTIRYRGKPLQKLDDLDYRRKIALVLQESLLVNASVFDNVAMGLRFRHASREEISQKVMFSLELLKITHLEKRSAKSLSGGEAQRVSLARAVALEPDLLLLDEPFSALDAPTRARLLADFQSLIGTTGITTIFVTHDMDEALTLGSRVAVLLEGTLRQVGTPDEVFAMPADEDVAAFVGVDTTLSGTVFENKDGRAIINIAGRTLEAVSELPEGQPVLFCLRPEDVTLWAGDSLPVSSARNLLAGKIKRMVNRGPLVHVAVDCGFSVNALITRASAREMGLEVGSDVTVSFKASAVHLIPRK